MENNYLVIMAGGIGSRFWPMSTSETPKQFLDILGTGKTMIQQTVDRIKDIIPPQNIFIVTSSSYKEIIKQQLPFLDDNQVLLEPCMRNTAPCIAYASYKIYSQNPDANIVVAPSDHLITDETGFRTIIKQALEYTSKQDVLLTLGIHPHRPETGYGYIQSEQKDIQIGEINKVASFKEKPNIDTAKEYLHSGSYLWNSGIFIWSAKSIIKAFEDALPNIAETFAKGDHIYNTIDEQDYINNVYPSCQNISIDYGILEKANNIYVLASEFGWSDLGTWGSLWEKRHRDNDGNSVVGSGVHLFDCNNTIVTVPEKRQVVLQGLDNYIVVEANGIIMVCQKEEEQRIKEFREKVLNK
ncbi:mannose-1-phosphate guanylyltransferase [Halosquirtibacter xylanolyticus]|uniref:mannose-1-phosphate guanylyltransferase n=1 Tax=Halosquirtibacter xylanolyticus TaxID=3374599 RepID=UPI00374A92B3|nr:mannose-1-phosphate guanylyltransferase [Prolixibacteraceae bacterium]